MAGFPWHFVTPRRLRIPCHCWSPPASPINAHRDWSLTPQLATFIRICHFGFFTTTTGSLRISSIHQLCIHCCCPLPFLANHRRTQRSGLPVFRALPSHETVRCHHQHPVVKSRTTGPEQQLPVVLAAKEHRLPRSIPPNRGETVHRRLMCVCSRNRCPCMFPRMCPFWGLNRTEPSPSEPPSRFPGL